jgi:hypothetical protein
VLRSLQPQLCATVLCCDPTANNFHDILSGLIEAGKYWPVHSDEYSLVFNRSAKRGRKERIWEGLLCSPPVPHLRNRPEHYINFCQGGPILTCKVKSKSIPLSVRGGLRARFL